MRPEVSVVMPCLDEEKTIGICVSKALKALKDSHLKGEVIVVDNGSSDRSVKLAKQAGARVVFQPVKGYGSAYQKGFEEAQGRYIIMGDGDDTYDFSEVPRFYNKLKEGYDLVMGSRLRGQIKKGAMPWLHKHIGNPALSSMLNFFFNTRISDSHCGMRGIRKEAYERLGLRTIGMEFASEMVIKSAKEKLKIAEIPITYYPRRGESKLSSFRDGWRHLRFMLMYSPDYLFIFPGLIMFWLGFFIMALLLKGSVIIGGFSFDIHPMVVGSLLMILGFQVMTTGLFAKSFSVVNGFEKQDIMVDFIHKHVSLERGVVIGMVVLAGGLAIDIQILLRWLSTSFGELAQLRSAIFGSTLIILGAQAMFSAFFLSMLVIERK